MTNSMHFGGGNVWADLAAYLGANRSYSDDGEADAEKTVKGELLSIDLTQGALKSNGGLSGNAQIYSVTYTMDGQSSPDWSVLIDPTAALMRFILDALTFFDPKAAWDHPRKGIYDFVAAIMPTTVNSTGSAENDTFTGPGFQLNSFSGLAGNDMFNVFPGRYSVMGGDDVDTLNAADTARGFRADLSVNAFTFKGLGYDSYIDSVENVYGTDRKDKITGDSQDNELRGENGNDKLKGEDGEDELDGGKGRDDLDGGPGSDTVNGGKGKDTVTGGDGNDEVNGQGGKDDVVADPGNDTMSGGGGADAFLFFFDPTPSASFGDDTITDFSSKDRGVYIDGPVDVPNIDIVENGSGFVRIDAGPDSITLEGVSLDTFFYERNFKFDGGQGIIIGAGGYATNGKERILIGTEFADELYAAKYMDAGGGADKIFLGATTKKVSGGSGADTFDIDKVAERTGGKVKITDYSTEDTIRLKATSYTLLFRNGDDDWTFAMSGGAQVVLKGTSGLELEDINIDPIL